MQIRIEQGVLGFVATLIATGEVGFGISAEDAVADLMADYEVEGLEIHSA